MPFNPQSVMSQGCVPNSLLFRYFHFKFTFESIKELGSASFLLMIQLTMDENNYLKLKHISKLSSLNALNWPINVSNSCKVIQIKLPQLKLLECI